MISTLQQLVMEEDKKVDPLHIANTDGQAASPLQTGLLQQFRQLSIPIWARVAVLLITGILFLSNVSLIAILFIQDLGIQTPALLTPKTPDRWLSSSITLLSAIFVPAMIVTYLVFAETGVRSLRSKTHEVLVRLIPECLREIHFPTFDDNLAVEVLRPGRHSTICQYVLSATFDGLTKKIRIVVSINVRKACIILLAEHTKDPSNIEETHRNIRSTYLKHTLEGAEREGYSVMSAPSKEMINGVSYCSIVLLRPLQSDFLWDPSQKLHFAQDLANFCHSVFSEGWETTLEPA